MGSGRSLPGWRGAQPGKLRSEPMDPMLERPEQREQGLPGSLRHDDSARPPHTVGQVPGRDRRDCGSRLPEHGRLERDEPVGVMAGWRAPSERGHVPHAESLVLERGVRRHVDRERVGREWHVGPAEEKQRPTDDGEVQSATLNRPHHGPLPSIEPLENAPTHPKWGQTSTS